MQTIQQMVKEFHDTFGADTSPTPTMSVSLRDLRLRLIHEEFHELLDASAFYLELTDGKQLDVGEEIKESDIKLIHEEGKIQNVIEMVDALGDLIYVVYGMGLAMNVDLDKVVAEIHRSNMSKTDMLGQPIVNGVTLGYREGQPGYDSSKPTGKILKGPNYFKPNIAKALGLDCTDERCLHYGTPHAHATAVESGMADTDGPRTASAERTTDSSDAANIL